MMTFNFSVFLAALIIAFIVPQIVVNIITGARNNRDIANKLKLIANSNDVNEIKSFIKDNSYRMTKKDTETLIKKINYLNVSDVDF